jgi:hypothetical protein
VISTSRVRRLAATALIGALLSPALHGCTNTDDEPAGAQPCPAWTAPSEGVDAPADAAPDGGGLRIIEQGYTQLGRLNHLISIGAIVENTSAQAAYRTRVTFDFFDAKKQSLAPATRFFTLEIPIILPGQRIPIATWGYVVFNDTTGRPNTITDLQITLGETRWIAAADSPPQITTKLDKIGRDEFESSSGHFTYSADIRSCRELHTRGVVIVFRNSVGDLIGGALEPHRRTETCASGTHQHYENSYALPELVDTSRSEVYPYCDPLPPGPRLPDGPVN